MFNGSLDSSSDSNYMQPNPVNNTTATYTFPGSGIPFTTCEIAAIKWGDVIKANGVDISSLLSTSWADPSWVDITSSISSPLTSVSAARNSSTSSAIFGIKIDGVVMLDSTTQNLAYGTNGFHLAMDPAESGTIYSDDVKKSNLEGPKFHQNDPKIYEKVIPWVIFQSKSDTPNQPNQPDQPDQSPHPPGDTRAGGILFLSCSKVNLEIDHFFNRLWEPKCSQNPSENH